MDPLRIWIPRGVALSAFALYVLAAAPGLFWLDSGELSAASFQLGVAHPTGFPLYCVLGKVASFLPFGEIAFRINLLSAVCAALAVLWTCRLVVEVCEEDAAALSGAIVAGLLLAVSFTFFRQATVAEVYAPNAALIALTLLLFARLARGGEAATGLSLALVVGLGAGVHATYIFVLPPLLVYLVMRLRRGARWPLLAPLLVVMTAGATYAYLPVRSGTGRVATVDWGHPHTSGAFVDHVTAGRPRRSFEQARPTRSAAAMKSTTGVVVAFNAKTFYLSLTRHLGPLVWVALFGGVWWLLRRARTRWIGVTLVLLLFADSVFSIWLNPMGEVDAQNGVPFALAAAAVAGAGVAWFARTLGRAAPYGGAVVGAMLVVPAGLASFGPAFAASSGDLPRRFSDAGFAATPARGVALVQSDSVAAGMIYLSTVEAQRPDVAVLARQHVYGDRERTRAVLARSGAPAELALKRDPIKALLDDGRGVSWEIGNDTPPTGWTVKVGPVLGQVRPRPEVGTGTGDVQSAFAGLTHMLGHGGGDDASARRAFANALTDLGRAAYGRGDAGFAVRLFDAAIAVRPEHIAALVNRGVVSGHLGDRDAAIRFTERAASLDPNHVSARINLARWYVAENRDSDAARHLARARRVDSSNASAWALSALLDLRAKNVERAMRRLRRAHDLDPRNPDYLHLARQLARPVPGK